MAIYHCSLRIFSRSDGHSAVAAAAYRAGAVLKEQRTGRIHRYGKRKGVIDAFILAPPSTPRNLLDRAVLWNAAEASETRKNSRVAREVILALPHELTDTERKALASDMALYLVERYRVAVDVAVHSPVAGDGHDPRNHHAHLLFTTRELTPEGFGAKTRVLDDKQAGPQEVELLREVWETLANDALARAGFSGVKIDRRTLEGQGIDRIPQTHIGPEAKASEEAEKDDEEEGEDGKKGTASGEGEGSKSLSPSNITPKEPDTKKREIDYKTIDQGRRRSDFVEEIKRLNERRAAFSDIPLKEQIADIERLIEKLDTRVHRLEALKEKTGLGQRVLASFTKLTEVTKGLILGRAEYRGAVTLSETERANRAERQREHYGREYRIGLHEQIKTMRSNLDRLEQLKTSYIAYKGFVDKLEKEIVSAQPSITTLHKEHTKPATRETPVRIITPAELSIKLTLKAEIVREIIPTAYKPKDVTIGKTEPSIPPLKAELNKVAAPPINLINSFREQIIPTPREQSQNIASYKQPIKLEIKALSKAIEERQQSPTLKNEFQAKPTPDLTERKNWFTPATEKTRPLQKVIDTEIIKARKSQKETSSIREEFSRPDISRPAQITNKTQTEKIRQEAQELRSGVPPQYRTEPYEKPVQHEERLKSEKITSSLKTEFKSQTEIKSPSMGKTPKLKMSQGFNTASFNSMERPVTNTPEDNQNEEASPDL
ncbi:MAG: hypothetical protein DYH13_10905 [Alphaproteobacteria bacterium PRO2]|nr:hypothetical protein [Alphaproteobacteria bacterium PRO2]